MGDKSKNLLQIIVSLINLVKQNLYYKKYKDQFLYIFFGIMTTVINIFMFWFFVYIIHTNVVIANTIAWLSAVTVAYITNRGLVFHSNVKGFTRVLKEALIFVGGRVLTYLLEDLMLVFCISYLHMNMILIKIIATIGVMILNYLISKIYVFK